MPNGSAGNTFGLLGITATDLSLDKGTGTSLEYSETYRDTRGSEGGFNDQLSFTNTDMILAPGSVDQQSTTDELGLNGNAPLAANRHAIDSQSDTGLAEGARAGFLGSGVNENIPMKTNIGKHGSTIGDSGIGVADFDVSSDLPAPGGERAIAELDVFNARHCYQRS